MSSPADLTSAALAFAEAWAWLGPDLPDDYACHLTCREAGTLYDLLHAAGYREAAGAVLAAHAKHDEPGDAHYPHSTAGHVRIRP